jgi:hypothetical protein
MMEAIRADKEGRMQIEVLLQYLLDAASKNDALASLLASSNDLAQLLKDDQNLVPLFHVLASAVDATVKDEKASTSTRTAKRFAGARSTRTRSSPSPSPTSSRPSTTAASRANRRSKWSSTSSPM